MKVQFFLSGPMAEDPQAQAWRAKLKFFLSKYHCKVYDPYELVDKQVLELAHKSYWDFSPLAQASRMKLHQLYSSGMREPIFVALHKINALIGYVPYGIYSVGTVEEILFAVANNIKIFIITRGKISPWYIGCINPEDFYSGFDEGDKPLLPALINYLTHKDDH